MPEERMEYKVLLLGEGGVGKTSLVKRYVLSKYDEKYQKTFGTNVYSKEVRFLEGMEQVSAKLIIWDIMGQNIFPKVIRSYLKGAGGVLFVCDLTNKNSLSGLTQWIDLVQQELDKAAFVFLGNKSDLPNREFDLKALKNLSDVYSAPAMLTSAKSGEAVEAAFEALTKRIYRRQFFEGKKPEQAQTPPELPKEILAEDDILDIFSKAAFGVQISMPVIREQFVKLKVDFENPSMEDLEKVAGELIKYVQFMRGEAEAKKFEKEIRKALKERKG